MTDNSKSDNSTASGDNRHCSSKIKKLTSVQFQKQACESYLIFKNEGIFQCLVCHRKFHKHTTLSFKRHYHTLHSCDFGGYNDADRHQLIQQLKSNLKTEELLRDENKAALTLSYNISFQIAKEGRACEDGEFMRRILLSTPRVVYDGGREKIESLDLSRGTVMRRIFELSTKEQEEMHQRMKGTIAYSLVFDPVQHKDKKRLGVFIRGVDSNLCVFEYLLQLILVTNTTTSDDVFYVLTEAIADCGLTWENLFTMSVTRNSAAYSVGLIPLIRENLQGMDFKAGILYAPCLLHLDDLWLKSTKTYISAHGEIVPKIQQFFTDLETKYSDHIGWYGCDPADVNWFNIAPALKTFLTRTQEMRKNGHKLDGPVWLLDCAFLCDIIERLQQRNESLKGRNQLVIRFLDIMSAFQLKVSLWTKHLKDRNFFHFATMESVIRSRSIAKETINVDSYVNILMHLHDDVGRHANVGADLEKMVEIFTNPFKVEPAKALAIYQMELIDLQCDRTMLTKYEMHVNDLPTFYKNLPKETYPQMYQLATQILSMFGSTSLFELVSTSVNRCNKNSPTINEIHLKSMLRVMTRPTDDDPDIEVLLLKKTRPQTATPM